MSYRPLTDVWILARPKVKYYGAYPSGFLERARALLGVTLYTPILHVCAGKVREYPFRGVGSSDQMVDCDPDTGPTYCRDIVKEGLPAYTHGRLWPALLADPPYTEADAKRYAGSATFPNPSWLVKEMVRVVRPGGRVGILHYLWPRPPTNARSVAAIAVLTGFNNRVRIFSVFERLA